MTLHSIKSEKLNMEAWWEKLLSYEDELKEARTWNFGEAVDIYFNMSFFPGTPNLWEVSVSDHYYSEAFIEQTEENRTTLMENIIERIEIYIREWRVESRQT